MKNMFIFTKWKDRFNPRRKSLLLITKGDMCLDDAMSIKRNDNGTYTLFIHLANPTATIPYESNTMHEAFKKKSYYLFI